jgi:hypothetical protein
MLAGRSGGAQAPLKSGARGPVTIDEASFRALLDARGFLKAGGDGAPFASFLSRERAFTVFAQRPDARIDLGDWTRHAERFFATRLGLTTDKAYDGGFPRVDAARVVLAPAREGASLRGAKGTRTCWGRARGAEDLEAARRAVAAGAGLTELAERCAQVWLVEVEEDDDPVALRVAAIVAGVVLGPILSPGGRALFGPKTAREQLER